MKKIFLSNINAPIGQSLYESLRNDDEEPIDHHKFYATLDLTDGTLRPDGSYTIISVISKQYDRKKEFIQTVLSCDLILLDLHTGDLEEFEELLKSLKDFSDSGQKTVILISSVYTWGDTPLKPPPNDQGTSIIEESKIDTSQDHINPESYIKKLKTQFVPFDDLDFNIRKAYPKYESWKNIENLCLSLNKTENFNAYVLCAGVLYGLGEIALSYHFMSGWLGEVDALPFIAPGNNIIPTVHISDLTTMVLHIIRFTPSQRYLIGCDSSSDSQLSIIQSISSAMSDGKLLSVPYSEVMLESWAEPLSFHLLINSSKFFHDSFNPMSWKSKSGIVANIDLLNQEFNIYRGLRSIKIFLTGPPASGKSHYSRKLADHYSVPHIHINALISEILQSTTELGEKTRKKLADLRQHMIEEAESKKKKNQEIDYSKFNPRVPEDIVAEIVKWKLNSNICRNRGYVLDGWPRKHEDAKRLFCKDDESLDSDIYPDSFLIFKATNEFLYARVKTMPEQLVLGTHYNEEGMKRRLQVFRDLNTPDKQTLHDFFISHKSEIFEVEANLDENVAFEMIVKYIERNGKPFKFEAKDEIKLQETLINLDSVKNFKEDEVKKPENAQNVEYLIMMEQIRAKENNLLEFRSQPIRNYLMEKVAPAITDALFELCEKKPVDPVLFLHNFLKSKSLETKSK